MSEAALTLRRSGLVWWPLGVAMLVLDQVTKAWIEAGMILHQSIYVLPVLDIVYARNPGAAFSFLADAGGWSAPSSCGRCAACLLPGSACRARD